MILITDLGKSIRRKLLCHFVSLCHRDTAQLFSALPSPICLDDDDNVRMARAGDALFVFIDHLVKIS